jgi:DNA repair protein RadC
MPAEEGWIRRIPEEDRPRERVLAGNLEERTTAEILAVVLGRGGGGRNVLSLAQDLLVRFNGLRGLAESAPEALTQVRGIGPAQAARLVAACELGRRLVRTKNPVRAEIRSPEDVASLLMEAMRGLDREQFRVVLMDSKNRVLGIETVAVGTLNASLVHPREVLKPGIRKSAAALILVHNHPTGVAAASEEDIRLTRRIVEAGRIVGIEVLDHIIIGDGAYESLRETRRVDF